MLFTGDGDKSRSPESKPWALSPLSLHLWVLIREKLGRCWPKQKAGSFVCREVYNSMLSQAWGKVTNYSSERELTCQDFSKWQSQDLNPSTPDSEASRLTLRLKNKRRKQRDSGKHSGQTRCGPATPTGPVDTGRASWLQSGSARTNYALLWRRLEMLRFPGISVLISK